MGNGYLLNPVIFLIDTLFGLYILAVMLRLLLQIVRADFYNPFSQFLVKITNPPLKPLRRIIPGWGGIDVSSLVLLFSLQCASIVIMALLHGGALETLSIAGLLMATFTKLISLFMYIYFFSLVIVALLSWISTGGYNPVTAIMSSITEPLLRPIRRIMPPVGMLDLSVFVTILGLVVARMLIMPPLYALSIHLGFPGSLLKLLY
ncbi:MAG: YggT family protein [Sulfuriflexus sp.]|nr:YggT family protein [Sulfuriflexus sp.]